MEKFHTSRARVERGVQDTETVIARNDSRQVDDEHVQDKNTGQTNVETKLSERRAKESRQSSTGW